MKNNPDYLGASFVGIALRRFIDGVISNFDHIKG